MAKNFVKDLHTQLRTKNAAPPFIALSIGYAYTEPSSYNNIVLLAGSICVVFLTFFAHLQNDVADYDIDAKGRRASPLVRHSLPISTVKSWAYVFLILALVVAMLSQDKSLVVFSLIYAGLIWIYNKPPVQASRRPLLSIIVLGLLFAGLPIAYGSYIGLGALKASILYIALGMLIYRMSISVLKDYKDYAEDKYFNKNTFLVRFGPEAVKRVSTWGSIIGYLLILTSVATKTDTFAAWCILAILMVVAILSTHKRMALANTPNKFSNNNKIFQSLFETSIYFDAGVLLCLYIS